MRAVAVLASLTAAAVAVFLPTDAYAIHKAHYLYALVSSNGKVVGGNWAGKEIPKMKRALQGEKLIVKKDGRHFVIKDECTISVVKSAIVTAHRAASRAHSDMSQALGERARDLSERLGDLADEMAEAAVRDARDDDGGQSPEKPNQQKMSRLQKKLELMTAELSKLTRELQSQSGSMTAMRGDAVREAMSESQQEIDETLDAAFEHGLAQPVAVQVPAAKKPCPGPGGNGLVFEPLP